MKNRKKHIVSLFVLLTLIVNIISPVMSVAADKTDLADISMVNIYIDRGKGFEDYIIEGVKVPGQSNPIQGNGIKIEYKWGINKDNLAQMQAGDEINFNLPTDFYSFSDSIKSDLKDENGNVVGTVQIVSNKIKVVLTEKAFENDSLKNGIVFAMGQIIKSGIDEEVDVDGGIDLPSIPIDKPGSADGDKENTRTEPIFKNGVQLQGREVVRWDTYLNNGNATKRFNGEPYETLDNAFFIDELKGPQTFNAIAIKTVLTTATSSGKASELILANIPLGPLSQPYGNFFTTVNAPAGITLDEFKLLLKDESNKTNKGSWGVIDEKTVVVYFGNIPNSGISIPIKSNIDIAKTHLDTLLSQGKINQVQYDKTYEHYASGIEDQLIQFLVTVDAKVDEETPTQELSNQSKLIWSDKEEDSNIAIVKFESHGGSIEGVEPKAIKIEKKDDKGTILPNIVFKIQKLNEVTGKYEDYTAPDGGTLERKTDANGIVEFKKLHTGKYKVVEITKLEGYDDPIYDPSDQFEIKETDTKGIFFKVINPKIEKINLKVEKVWDDENNQDGKRPTSITVDLYKTVDGVETKLETQTLNELNSWSYQWTELPVKEAGKTITYTVKEANLPEGYTASQKTENGTVTITNSYTPEETEVEGNKLWDDGNDQDGKRPSSIKIDLYKKVGEGSPTKVDEVEVTPDAQGNWKYNFTGLPKYEGGELITYSVKEQQILDYTSKVEGFDITNSYTPGETGISVIKTWNDSENQDGKRPTSITVDLYKTVDGVETKLDTETQTLNEGNSWSYTWTGLPEKEAGKTITYTVKEANLPEGYTTSQKTENGTVTITNSYTPEETEVEGNKLWDDGNDQDGKRPSSIKIDLYKKVGEGSPTKVDEVEVTPDAQGNWKYNFTGLPKYEGGELITYSVKEQQILDYTSKVEGFDITNSYTPGETQISVIKTWNDSENQDGKRPTSITVDLYKTVDGVETKLDTETQTLNEGNSWRYTWTGLPEKEAGKTITYTVKEANLPEGYTTSQKTENGTVTITNSYTPEETEVKGNKLWDDANDQDGKRPSSIAVELYKTVEDQTTKVDEVEVIPDANGDWKYNFKNLPKYADGEEILYSVKEQVVEDYTSKIKDFNITNSYTPGKTEIEVIKNWNDKNDQDKIRPTSIKVELYARESGTDKEGNLVDTVKLSDKNNWSHKWTDLDTHKDKKELEYYVVEKEVPEGYEVTYKVNSVTRTVFITNSHTPVDPPTPEEPGKPWLPKTGITGIAGLGILGMSLVGLGAVQFKKKK